MSRAPKVTIGKSIREGENIGQFMQRIKKHGPRKPLRTLKELADEFGISAKSLQAVLARKKGAPKPIFSTGGGSGSTPQNTWYDPDEVRKWFAESCI